MTLSIVVFVYSVSRKFWREWRSQIHEDFVGDGIPRVGTIQHRAPRDWPQGLIAIGGQEGESEILANGYGAIVSGMYARDKRYLVTCAHVVIELLDAKMQGVLYLMGTNEKFVPYAIDRSNLRIVGNAADGPSDFVCISLSKRIQSVLQTKILTVSRYVPLVRSKFIVNNVSRRDGRYEVMRMTGSFEEEISSTYWSIDYRGVPGLSGSPLLTRDGKSVVGLYRGVSADETQGRALLLKPYMELMDRLEIRPGFSVSHNTIKHNSDGKREAEAIRMADDMGDRAYLIVQNGDLVARRQEKSEDRFERAFNDDYRIADLKAQIQEQQRLEGQAYPGYWNDYQLLKRLEAQRDQYLEVNPQHNWGDYPEDAEYEYDEDPFTIRHGLTDAGPPRKRSLAREAVSVVTKKTREDLGRARMMQVLRNSVTVALTVRDIDVTVQHWIDYKWCVDPEVRLVETPMECLGKFTIPYTSVDKVVDLSRVLKYADEEYFVPQKGSNIIRGNFAHEVVRRRMIHEQYPVQPEGDMIRLAEWVGERFASLIKNPQELRIPVSSRDVAVIGMIRLKDAIVTKGFDTSPGLLANQLGFMTKRSLVDAKDKEMHAVIYHLMNQAVTQGVIPSVVHFKIKDEPNPVRKREEPRAYCVFGAVITAMEMGLCGWLSKAAKDAYMADSNQVSYGQGAEKRDCDYLSKVFSWMDANGTVISTDISGWDKTVPAWVTNLAPYLIKAIARRIMSATVFEAWTNLFDAYWSAVQEGMYASDGEYLYRMTPGMRTRVISGRPMTSILNHLLRVVCGYVAASRAGIRPYHIHTGGDDAFEAVADKSHARRLYDSYKSLGLQVKEMVVCDRQDGVGRLNFCSHTWLFTDGGNTCVRQTFEKSMLKFAQRFLQREFKATEQSMSAWRELASVMPLDVREEFVRDFNLPNIPGSPLTLEYLNVLRHFDDALAVGTEEVAHSGKGKEDIPMEELPIEGMQPQRHQGLRDLLAEVRVALAEPVVEPDFDSADELLEGWMPSDYDADDEADEDSEDVDAAAVLLAAGFDIRLVEEFQNFELEATMLPQEHFAPSDKTHSGRGGKHSALMSKKSAKKTSRVVSSGPAKTARVFHDVRQPSLMMPTGVAQYIASVADPSDPNISPSVPYNQQPSRSVHVRLVHRGVTNGNGQVLMAFSPASALFSGTGEAAGTQGNLLTAYLYTTGNLWSGPGVSPAITASSPGAQDFAPVTSHLSPFTMTEFQDGSSEKVSQLGCFRVVSAQFKVYTTKPQSSLEVATYVEPGNKNPFELDSQSAPTKMTCRFSGSDDMVVAATGATAVLKSSQAACLTWAPQSEQDLQWLRCVGASAAQPVFFTGRDLGRYGGSNTPLSAWQDSSQLHSNLNNFSHLMYLRITPTYISATDNGEMPYVVVTDVNFEVSGPKFMYNPALSLRPLRLEPDLPAGAVVAMHRARRRDTVPVVSATGSDRPHVSHEEDEIPHSAGSHVRGELSDLVHTLARYLANTTRVEGAPPEASVGLSKRHPILAGLWSGAKKLLPGALSMIPGVGGALSNLVKGL
jgi:hypothetical protein